jgi:hypothetical protein
MDLCSGDGITVINSTVKNGFLHCGLVTVDRFIAEEATISHIALGLQIKIRLPQSLARQPMMTSLTNQQIQIIQENS